MKKYFKDLAYILTLAYLMGLLVGTFLVWGYTQTSSNILINLTASTNNVPFNETLNNASQSIWNESFLGSQNKTFWITLPKTATATNVMLTFTGYGNTTADTSKWNFSVSSQMDAPYGVTFNGTYFWVTSNDKACIYRYLANGTYDNWYFNVSEHENSPVGIYFDGTYFYFTGTQNIKVYKYDANGNYISNFSTSSQDVNPEDVYFNGTHYFVAGGSGRTVYLYNSTGSYIGTSWSINVDDNPNGAKFDGTYWWVTGNGNDKVYKFSSNFVYQNYNFNTTPETSTPIGLDTNGTYIWVAGATLTKRIFRFPIYQYPQNFYIDAGGNGDSDWSISGTLNGTAQTSGNLSSDVNTFLSTCSADANGNCNVTFIVHSDDGGILQISNINITYNYNMTNLFTSSFSSESKILNSNYTHTTIANFTTQNASNNFTVAGIYFNNSGITPVSCTLNGTSGTVSGSSCNISLSINKGNKFGNYTLIYNKGIIFTPLTAINWTQDTSSTTNVNGTTYIKGKASGNNSDSISYNNVQYDNSVATQEARDSTWTCNYPTATDLNLPASGIGNATSYGIFCTKSSMIYVMEGTGWVQDTSFTTEAGNWTYIKGKYRANNSDASINYTNVYFDTSLNNTAVRSGWNGYISATGYLNISAGQTNNSSSFNIYANKTGMITKLDAGDEILDPAFNSKKFANSSGWNYNTTWYYWISNISLNNTDELVNYSNVYWQNRLAGADFNYSGNISNGTASTVNFNSLVNVETKYRTKSVNVIETEVKEDATGYENDVNLYAPSDIDTSFRDSYYKSIYVNATLNSSYTSFDLFWWNGYAWEKHTSTSFYNFTVDANRNWATFYANQSASINYYSISSSAPVTVPPSEPTGGGGKITVTITGQNFTIEQPEFNLFGSPGGQLMTWITIKNLFSRVATPEFTCINGNYTIDFCKNVWFGEMEITEGKPQFRVYEIPAGTTSRIPMFIILPEEEGTWSDAFIVKVTLEGQEQLATATVSVSPFWGKIGEAINWFQGSTVFLNMRIPNSVIVLVSAIIIIILIVTILVELKRYGRKR